MLEHFLGIASIPLQNNRDLSNHVPATYDIPIAPQAIERALGFNLQLDFEMRALALTAQVNCAYAYALQAMPTHGLQSIFKSKIP